MDPSLFLFWTFLTKIVSNIVSILTLLVTFLVMVDRKFRCKQNLLSTYNQHLVFYLMIFAFLYSVSNVLYPSTNTVCKYTLLTQTLILANPQKPKIRLHPLALEQLLVGGDLADLLLHQLPDPGRNSTGQDRMVVQAAGLPGLLSLRVRLRVVGLGNCRLGYWMSVSEDNFYFNASKMECTLMFRFSKTIDFYLSIVPLSLCLSVSVYTLLRCYYLFKKYPEELTDLLLNEIKFYPLIFLLCNSTSFIQHILDFRDIEENISFFLVDQFTKGVQGALVCFVFFWKRLSFKRLSFNQILTGELSFSELTKRDLAQIERNQ